MWGGGGGLSRWEGVMRGCGLNKRKQKMEKEEEKSRGSGSGSGSGMYREDNITCCSSHCCCGGGGGGGGGSGGGGGGFCLVTITQYFVLRCCCESDWLWQTQSWYHFTIWIASTPQAQQTGTDAVKSIRRDRSLVEKFYTEILWPVVIFQQKNIKFHLSVNCVWDWLCFNTCMCHNSAIFGDINYQHNGKWTQY